MSLQQQVMTAMKTAMKAKDTTAASSFIDQLDKDIQAFQKKVGSYLDIPVNVVIAPDSKVYESWTKQSGRFPFDLA